jgi:hypothetical protein
VFIEVVVSTQWLLLRLWVHVFSGVVKRFRFLYMFLSICSGCDSFAELECFMVLEHTSHMTCAQDYKLVKRTKKIPQKTKQRNYFAVTWLLPICIRISFACCFRNHHHCSKDHIHALYDLIGENKDYTVTSTDN